MNKNHQVPFGPDSFAMNPEDRCACILLLDTSGSMNGRPINQLNQALIAFRNELILDPLAAKRVETCIISFGPVKIETDFQTVANFNPPMLAAAGDTPLGAAVKVAISKAKERKEVYKANGITYYRPWIFLITDSKPTDDWKDAARRIHEGASANSYTFYAIGVQGADMDILKQISPTPPLMLEGLRFREFFIWLSASLSLAAKSKPGNDIDLPPTSSWAKVDI